MPSSTSKSASTSSSTSSSTLSTLRVPLSTRPSRFDERFSVNMSNSHPDTYLASRVQKSSDDRPRFTSRKTSFEDFLPPARLSTWKEEDERKAAAKVGAKAKAKTKGLVGGFMGKTGGWQKLKGV